MTTRKIVIDDYGFGLRVRSGITDRNNQKELHRRRRTGGAKSFEERKEAMRQIRIQKGRRPR